MSMENQDVERIEKQGKRVVIYLYSGELKQLFGSYRREVVINEEGPISIEDVFQQVKTRDGLSLYDVLMESGVIKARYAVFMGGRNIETMEGARTPVPIGESIAILEVVARITGG